MKKLSAQRERSVFLNLPFEKKYEPIFVGLIVGLVTVGLIPRSVVELHENGDGRMARLFQLGPVKVKRTGWRQSQEGLEQGGNEEPSGGYVTSEQRGFEPSCA